jgi:hypothetical protein
MLATQALLPPYATLPDRGGKFCTQSALESWEELTAAIPHLLPPGRDENEGNCFWRIPTGSDSTPPPNLGLPVSALQAEIQR